MEDTSGNADKRECGNARMGLWHKPAHKNQ